MENKRWLWVKKYITKGRTMGGRKFYKRRCGQDYKINRISKISKFSFTVVAPLLKHKVDRNK
jgi:hypothetical protein